MFDPNTTLETHTIQRFKFLIVQVKKQATVFKSYFD